MAEIPDQGLPGCPCRPPSPREGGSCVQKGARRPGRYESYSFLGTEESAPFCLGVTELWAEVFPCSVAGKFNNDELSETVSVNVNGT